MDPTRAELLDKIKAQGDVVRKLKEQKAEKSMVRFQQIVVFVFDPKISFTNSGFFKVDK